MNQVLASFQPSRGQRMQYGYSASVAPAAVYIAFAAPSIHGEHADGGPQGRQAADSSLCKGFLAMRAKDAAADRSEDVHRSHI